MNLARLAFPYLLLVAHLQAVEISIDLKQESKPKAISMLSFDAKLICLPKLLGTAPEGTSDPVFAVISCQAKPAFHHLEFWVVIDAELTLSDGSTQTLKGLGFFIEGESVEYDLQKLLLVLLGDPFEDDPDAVRKNPLRDYSVKSMRVFRASVEVKKLEKRKGKTKN